VLLVLGGDGTMLHAIRAHWRRRVPFFGVNFGHLGFLLNGLDDLHGALPEEALHRELPLLRVDTTAPDGTRASHLAFNDAWVERESGQTAWVEVRVNDQVRLARAVCDGILLSTAAGSTSYARAMGVAPLQVDTALLTLAGSNVMSPEGWRQAHLPLDARVEFRGLDPDKRPLRGFVDGAPCGPVAHMAHAVSRVAAVELAFSPGHDIAHKLTRIQFPALARET
jgi:NAD kinase